MEENRSLSGLTHLLLDRDQIENDVRAPYFSAGLRYALLFADALVQVLDTDFGVTISAFSNAKDSGLFFHNEIDRRAAKVMSHPVAGGVMLFVGSSEDFEFPSRFAKDYLRPICFEEEEIGRYAREIAPHFSKANPPVSFE
ncbi:hypothetical protein [Paraburkholderia sp. SIMBA_054]|uniref:hypothetical protein n=1 Tax=Paraburkholderia sp. SIMBA_054 TaxID=3085795 RepID=UPI00397E062C